MFSPETLIENVELGVAPTWGQLLVAIPIAMLAYTGVETVSNLAEEVHDPVRSMPPAYKLVAAATFAMYFTLPLIALSALPVYREADGDYVTQLGLGPRRGRLRRRPGARRRPEPGDKRGPVIRRSRLHGVLAATILFIATNAGVIGASRITYAMAGYRQLPSVFRRLHRRFRTPWLALAVFAGVLPILTLLPGETTFLGTMYSFGATLSFTVAHASLIALRYRRPDDEIAFRARPNLRFRGVDWPLFAILGLFGTGIAFVVIVLQDPATRYAGFGWLAVGLVAYAVYRRRFVHAPLAATVRAPVVLGPADPLDYRRILVPVLEGLEVDEAMNVASRLAAERGALIVAVGAVEVPLDKPLDAEQPEREEKVNVELDDARAIGDLHGVDVVTRLVRTRHAGRAIVDEVERREAEIVVVGAPRGGRGRSAIFPRTVDFVLRQSPCRVMVAAPPPA